MSKKPAVSKNSIMVIQPYWHNGTWVFDDPMTDLVREPFVSGVPEIINKMVKHIKGAKNGFRMLFSATPFPDAVKMEWTREDCGGNWYRCWELGDLEGWLCPALFKYFPTAPKTIYAKAEPLNGGATR